LRKIKLYAIYYQIPASLPAAGRRGNDNMTFLNPAILWGLAAISIPIIIHIFNLKKTKKIEFSTLMFLKEIQQSKYKKIKLKQLLILLCRIAMIILLVLAFARPFQKGYLGADEKARSSVLLILDNSFSMQSREQQGSEFELAKSKILETVNLLGEDDEIFYTTTSDIDKPSRINLFKDINALKDSVMNSKVSDVTRYFNEVIVYAKRILESSANTYKEIFLFTDGQKNFIEGLEQIPSKIELDEFTKVNVILTGNRAGNNISLDTINTVTKIFERNRNVKLKCTVNNRNNFNVSNKSIVINFSGGKYRDEKVIDIPSNSSVEVEFNFTPEVTGFAGGYIELIQSEISDDEIVNDNKRFFSFYVPSKVKLLMASNSPSDLDYVKLALSSSEELMRDSSNNKAEFFDIKQISTGGLANETLNSYDCVLLADYPTFSNSDADKLYEYVQSGGGVVIYPGSNINIENYNNVFLKRFELPPITNYYGSARAEESIIFSKIDFEHPIFEGIFKEQNPSGKNFTKESPHIKYGLNLLPGNNTLGIIKLNNEKSFLNEYTSGKGKILFYSVTPDMVNSDFPASSLFSPITVRSILYLANSSQLKEAVTGRDYFAELSKLTNGDDTLKLKNLQNTVNENLKVSAKSDAITDLKPFLTYSSVYTIQQSGQVVFSFPCNPEKSESGTEKIENKDIENNLKSRFEEGITVISPTAALSASVFELRTGREIWQYFLIAALLFLALETLISRLILKTS
jgi:hypothetical protein